MKIKLFDARANKMTIIVSVHELVSFIFQKDSICG